MHTLHGLYVRSLDNVIFQRRLPNLHKAHQMREDKVDLICH